jgi:heavy metal sensor kinase
MNLTIRTRIALLTSGLLLLILAGFSVFLYVSFSTQLYQALDDNLRHSAQQALATVENEKGSLRFDQQDLQSSNLTGDEDRVIRLLSPAGELLDNRGNEHLGIAPATLRSGFHTLRFRDNGAGLFRLLSVPIEANSEVSGELLAYLQVGQDLEAIQQTLARLRVLLLIAAPVLVLFAALAGYWLAGRALAPIESIRSQAASISAHDLGRRLDLSLPDDEVGRLARTFDEMLARLDESFRRQRRFTADASHELRTPLAVVRGVVDVSLEQPRTPCEYAATLRSIGAETERMTRLVNELLLLARSDAAELVLEREAVDLADLLAVLVEQMQAEAEVAGVTLTTELPVPLRVWGDRDRLLQLFINLVDNGLTYAPGSHVNLRGEIGGGFVVIAVIDTGPGIPPEHLPHLFERFYRVDKARSRARGGSGLGLAIAQEIVHAHGGAIQVESEVGVGTTFTVRLPQDG